MGSKRVSRWRALGIIAGASLAPLAMFGVQTASAGAASASSGANPYSPAFGHLYRHGVVPTTTQLD